MNNVSLILNGTCYQMMRSAKCSNSDKFSRAAKLLHSYNKILDKMDGIIYRGHSTSEMARLALCVKLLMTTGIRVGNESSAEGYMTKLHPHEKGEPHFTQTYGLTTIKTSHVSTRGRYTYLNFIGKKSVENSFRLEGFIAQQLKRVIEWSKSNDEDTIFSVSAYQLTKFIKKYVGRQFSPKDFRTMRANMYAWEKLTDLEKYYNPTTKKEFRAEQKEICTYVSEHLNNTPAVCKKNYIDPKFWDEFSELRYIDKD